MDRSTLLIELTKLNQLWRDGNESRALTLEKMESLVELYLQENPHDNDMLIKLALIVYTVPLADDIKAMECLNKVLTSDPGSAIATLILAYVIAHLSYLNEEVFNKLCIVKSNNKEIMSMVAFAKSWHYEYLKNDTEYEKTLLESIELCDHHVRNYSYLGTFYLARGKKAQGIMALQNAVRNVKHVYTGDETYTIYDADEFLSERLKGIHITDSNLEFIFNELGNNTTEN